MKAITCYQKALENQNPATPKPTTTSATPCYKNRSVDEAIQQYQSALEIKPDYAEAHNQPRCRPAPKGTAGWTRRNSFSRPSTSSLIRPGRILISAGFFSRKGGRTKRWRICKRLWRFVPDYAKAHAGLGIALFQKGRVDEAIARFQKALKIEPDDSDTHINLGLASFQKRAGGRGNSALPKNFGNQSWQLEGLL